MKSVSSQVISSTFGLRITVTPSCVKLHAVSLPGLPGGDQRGSGEQAAAAGYGRAPGQSQPRQQSCWDPTQTHQSQWALATPAGPHRCQVGVQDSSVCFWTVEFERVERGEEEMYRYEHTDTDMKSFLCSSRKEHQKWFQTSQGVKKSVSV